MCTVTLFRSEQHSIITMNRDERKDRPEGLFTQASTSSGLNYLHPTDTHSWGTWLGINARGIGACVLNGYGEKHLSDRKHIISRGCIIPSLLQAESLEEAYRKLDQLPLNRFRNFDLLLFSKETVLTFLHKNGQGTVKRVTDDSLMLSSSSWNKEAVLDFRREKFHNFLAEKRHTTHCAESILSEFHLNSTENSQFEILMHRPESQTKSVSQIILDNNVVSFRYMDERSLTELSNLPADKSAASSGTIYQISRQ